MNTVVAESTAADWGRSVSKRCCLTLDRIDVEVGVSTAGYGNEPKIHRRSRGDMQDFSAGRRNIGRRPEASALHDLNKTEVHESVSAEQERPSSVCAFEIQRGPPEACG